MDRIIRYNFSPIINKIRKKTGRTDRRPGTWDEEDLEATTPAAKDPDLQPDTTTN